MGKTPQYGITFKPGMYRYLGRPQSSTVSRSASGRSRVPRAISTIAVGVGIRKLGARQCIGVYLLRRLSGIANGRRTTNCSNILWYSASNAELVYIGPVTAEVESHGPIESNMCQVSLCLGDMHRASLFTW